MASLVLGDPPISSQLLTIPSCKSFSRSKTLGASLSAPSISSLSISTTIPLPTFEQLHKAQFVYLLLGRNEGFGVEDTFDAKEQAQREKTSEATVSLSPTKKDQFEDDASVKIEIDESF
ncbi:30S ribosomal protein S31, chloroplastic-like [Juglans regia]|uniref:30S ribosomal protein S31, chloroplastic-like n=1 Tax=Juglans regia TaxID=51240 RepID=A0A6P9EKZ3_JUGRE|nr:30S ribosomal protein S31, chloroplastic-like [Juglans regia]